MGFLKIEFLQKPPISFSKYIFHLFKFYKTNCSTASRPIKIGIRTFIAEKILTHHPDSGKFRGSSSQSHCSPQFPRETLRFSKTKNPTHQHYSRHRENIGRIGSLRVFWQMSMIAVFPQKTVVLMFVGFDSQNTSHSFPHYPNWDSVGS